MSDPAVSGEIPRLNVERESLIDGLKTAQRTLSLPLSDSEQAQDTPKSPTSPGMENFWRNRFFSEPTNNALPTEVTPEFILFQDAFAKEKAIKINIDLDEAKSIQKDLARSGSSTNKESCLKRWRSLLAPPTEKQKYGNWKMLKDASDIRRIPGLSWPAIPQWSAYAIIESVNDILDQDTWCPVLVDPKLSAPSSFYEIRKSMQAADEALKKACENFSTAESNNKKSDGSDSSYEQFCHARNALDNCIKVVADVLQNYNIAYHTALNTLHDNAASSALNLTSAVVGYGLPQPIGGLLAWGLNFANTPAHKRDLAARDENKNRLNMQYAKLPEDDVEAMQMLQKLWCGPLEAKLNLLAEILEFEAITADPENKIKLETERKHVLEGNLEELEPDSRSVKLLSEPNTFRLVAINTRMLTQFIEGLASPLVLQTVSEAVDNIPIENDHAATAAGIAEDTATTSMSNLLPSKGEGTSTLEERTRLPKQLERFAWNLVKVPLKMAQKTVELGVSAWNSREYHRLHSHMEQAQALLNTFPDTGKSPEVRP